MAEMQNTGNPLSSNDLKDLNDNLIVLDRQLNSEELTTTDRFGNTIPTVAGMRKKMEDLASQISTNDLVPIDGSRAADKLSLKDGESSLEVKAENGALLIGDTLKLEDGESSLPLTASNGELLVGDKQALVASTVDDVKTVDEALNFTKDINVTGALQQNGSDVVTKDNLYSSLESVVLYPSGTEVSPPNITINQRVVIDNPFNTWNCKAWTELSVDSGVTWFAFDGMFYAGEGGYGVKTNLLNNTKIVVQSGKNSLINSSTNSGNPLGTTTSYTSALFRVRVIRLGV